MHDSFESVRAFNEVTRHVREAQETMRMVAAQTAHRRELEQLATFQGSYDAIRELRRVEDHVRGSMITSRFLEEAKFVEATRREAERVRQFSLGVAADALQWARREQDALRSTFDALRAFGDQPLNQFMAARGLEEAALHELVAGAAANALGRHQSALDASVLHHVQSELSAELSDASALSLADAVAHAVIRALHESGRRTDWRFVIGIVVGILMLLLQEYSSSVDQKELRASVEEVRERLVSQERLIHLLLTRVVKRSTLLRLKPSSRSRIVSRLEPGATVVVLARRSKWTLVAVSGANEGAALRGWLLNKYLN